MAELKINGDVSGSTTIKAPDTGTDETIELSTALAAKAPLASPTFTGTPALPEGTTLAGSLLTSGKILQIVRATDGTSRSTTSTSFVDASLSVTITPQKSDSAILIIVNVLVASPSDQRMHLQITDASNNAISGSEQIRTSGWEQSLAQAYIPANFMGYATPATTSATTYKVRYLTTGGTSQIRNDINTGQMYAIEVSA